MGVRVLAGQALLLFAVASLGACGEVTRNPPTGSATGTDTGVGTGASTVTDTATQTSITTQTTTVTGTGCDTTPERVWCTGPASKTPGVRFGDCSPDYPQAEQIGELNVFRCLSTTAPCLSGNQFSLDCDVLDAATIAVGRHHACAIQRDRSAVCWGAGTQGQLGFGEFVLGQTKAVPVQTMLAFDSLSAGGEHTCAVIAGGRIQCWGSDVYRELGRGVGSDKSAVPVDVTGLPPAIRVSAGPRRTCAVLGQIEVETGRVACWGAEPLGDGSGLSSSTPVEVLRIDDAVEISVGDNHSCAVRSDATVWCWGGNDLGQLGDGTNESREEPMPVSGIRGAMVVASGLRHSCALLANGGVACWGSNDFGQLGDGVDASLAFSPLAAPVVGIGAARAIATGSEHTCALSADRRVHCWGAGTGSRLANGNFGDSAAPRLVPSLNDVTAIAAGEGFSCARVADGAVFCWGANGHGQLGNMSLLDSPQPAAVVAPNPAR